MSKLVKQISKLSNKGIKMNILRAKPWAMNDNQVTDEKVYNERRYLTKKAKFFAYFMSKIR